MVKIVALLRFGHEFGHCLIVFSNYTLKPPPLVGGGRGREFKFSYSNGV